MGWADDSGKHEGWGAAVTKDGRLAGTHGGSGVVVKGITGNYPEDTVMKGYEAVPADDVTGWRVACECGWTGATFIPRKPGESTFPTEEVEDDIFHPEWKRHVEPFTAQVALEDAFWAQRKAAAAVDKAVAEAREAGVSWQDIGIATHMSRQAAHERWS